MNPYEFYSFRCEGDEPASAELLIFAAIGDWEDMGEIGAKAFAKDLSALPKSVQRIDLHINSPGGSVFEAQAIYSRLADHRSTKHVYVDGLAASAASIIAMVGHKIYIRANASMMIHLPSGITMGNADDMRQFAATLDSITEPMINVYQKRTGLERDEIRAMLAAETWFSPQEAVDKGFADEVRGVVKAAAIVGEKRVFINGIEHDLSRFHNIPAFTATTQPKTMPTLTVKPTATAEAPAPPEAPAPTPPAPTPPAPAPAPSPPAPTPAPTAPTPPAAATFDQGVDAERKRVTSLQKLDKPATHDVIVKAIADGKHVTDIVDEITAALEKAASKSNRRVDASQLDGIPGSDGSDNENGFGGLITQKVKARLKNRGGRRINSRN